MLNKNLSFLRFCALEEFIGYRFQFSKDGKERPCYSVVYQKPATLVEEVKRLLANFFSRIHYKVTTLPALAFVFLRGRERSGCVMRTLGSGSFKYAEEILMFGIRAAMETSKSSPLGSRSLISTTDVFEQAASLRCWSQDYLQLSPGNFFGEIQEISFSPLQIFREYVSQSVDMKAMPRPNCYTIGLPLALDGSGTWQGRPIWQDSIFSLCPNEGLYFRMPKAASVIVATIDADVFDNFAYTLTGMEASSLISKSKSILVEPKIAEFSRAFLLNVLSSFLGNSQSDLHSASVSCAVQEIMDVLLSSLIADPLKDKCRTSHSVQRAIVERAREFVLNDYGQVPTVAELCCHLRMSRRGLHHAFINVLGINTVTFLRLVRLHEVRKELHKASPDEKVNRIAAKWGYWHMGMFSRQYKELFGELPSVSLKKGCRSSAVQPAFVPRQFY